MEGIIHLNEGEAVVWVDRDIFLTFRTIFSCDDDFFDPAASLEDEREFSEHGHSHGGFIRAESCE